MNPRLCGRVVQVVNKVSQNLHAEMLLREVGYATRNVGTLAAGLDERQKFLQQAGISNDGYDFADGSGLARQGVTTPASTVTLLRYMWMRPEKKLWLESLPVGGIDGSLRRRFKGLAGGDRVHAKTGSLSHVAALSGYLLTDIRPLDCLLDDGKRRSGRRAGGNGVFRPRLRDIPAAARHPQVRPRPRITTGSFYLNLGAKWKQRRTSCTADDATHPFLSGRTARETNRNVQGLHDQPGSDQR